MRSATLCGGGGGTFHRARAPLAARHAARRVSCAAASDPAEVALSRLRYFDNSLTHTSQRAAVSLGAGLAAAALSAAPFAGRADAALKDYDVTGKGMVTVRMNLGEESTNAFVFSPAEVTFEAGRLTNLVLKNPSAAEHYFSAPEFSAKVYSVLVSVNGVEVKGPVTELALEPGAELSWVFVPIRPGTYQLLCPVAGHVEAGMVGALKIVSPQ